MYQPLKLLSPEQDPEQVREKLPSWMEFYYAMEEDGWLVFLCNAGPEVSAPVKVSLSGLQFVDGAGRCHQLCLRCVWYCEVHFSLLGSCGEISFCHRPITRKALRVSHTRVYRAYFRLFIGNTDRYWEAIRLT
jgi:hypothetical protein